MTEPKNSTSAADQHANDELLSKIKEDYDREEANEKNRKAINDLISFLDPERYVGDLISMDYGTAEVLVHDRLRQDVGGVPHGCLLLATRMSPTDEESPNLNNASTSLILLRALKSSTLPNDIEMKQARLEAGQRATQTPDNWDEGGKTDQFTLDQMRYAGVHCRILGTLRMNPNAETGEWQLKYGSDINNFYAGQGMKVYKPAGQILGRIVNYTRHENPNSMPIEIGRLRYAASVHDPKAPEAVAVKMVAEDLIAQRTALFGMTRTGKSNTTKTIASAVFQLRIPKNGQCVGQLIFDPNGEYANENPQDQGCLKNLANIRDDLRGDVVTYGLQPHPYDPERNITRFNFFGDGMPSGKNPEKREWDEHLHSLYQGKQIINQALQEESGGYITSFINVDVTAPPDVSDWGANTRYRQVLLIYKSVLAAAGFPKSGKGISTEGLFSQEIRREMENDEEMNLYATHMEANSEMSWDLAQNFCRELSGWVKKNQFRNFDRGYAQRHGHNWSDDRFLGLLRIFENTRGLAIIQKTRQWHSLKTNTDYAEDIVNHIRAGRLVIFDQALGDPEMNEQAAARIMRTIFAAQQQSFVNPEVDKNTGEIKKPPSVIVYVEEAHTLLPKGNETDTLNIWARVAKEGAKFNIGLVYSTQEPSTIQTNILKNTENWFVAHLNNTDETNQLKKYNDFADFTDSIIKVNETGFLRVRTLSSPYTLPVQIAKFEAPLSAEKQNSENLVGVETQTTDELTEPTDALPE